MKTKLLLMMLVVGVLSGLAVAAEITLPNPGFERRSIDDPEDVFAIGQHKYIWNSKDYWAHFECDNNGGPLRLWRMGPGAAPEGEYTVRVSSRYNDNEYEAVRPIRDWEACCWLLDDTFDPDVPYELSAKVMRHISYLWNGYAVQLVAGGTYTSKSKYAGHVDGGTVIAEDYNTKTAAPGQTITSIVKYVGGTADPGLAGQRLQIRLCALEDPADHSTTSYAIFDDVRLTYGPVDAGPDMITWTGMGVPMAPVISPSYGAPGSYAWSAAPDDGVVISDESAEDAIVTITKPTLVSTEVTIGNAGFEQPMLVDGSFETAPPSWTDGYYDVTDPCVWVVGDAEAGVYNPTADAGYGGVAPEGDNVMFATCATGLDRGMNQVLSAKLEADTQYDLSALVGNPFGFNEDTTTGDYRIELLAGGVVLASDTGPSPADDTTWTTASLTYDSGQSPAQLGEALEIRLLAVDFTDNKGVDFDDVKLTAVGPAAEPYVVKMTLVVDDTEEDDMLIKVYNDACSAARLGGGMEYTMPTDLDDDCDTDMGDFAVLAELWLDNTELTEAM